MPEMNSIPYWIAYLSALLVPLLAILGAFIAYNQWRLAQNKLKFDLFDRRIKIYEAATGLISSIMISGKAKDQEVFNYMVAIREAKWLLSPGIAEYLDQQLYGRAIELQTLKANLEGAPVDEARAKNIQDQVELKKWFTAQYLVLDMWFAPFLKLQH